MSVGGSVKGHMHRVIRAPGYHIHSKYDLKGLRERMHSNKSKPSDPNLPLTPMIDMMSILIIYLLMNFSATGEIFFVSKNGLKLPDANHARALESAALISITQDKVYFDAEKMAENPVTLEVADENLPQLRTRLQQLRVMEETIHPGQPFKGLVNIQADQNTPLIYVKRVMNVLISEGWTGINFAVEPGSSQREISSETKE